MYSIAVLQLTDFQTFHRNHVFVLCVFFLLLLLSINLVSTKEELKLYGQTNLSQLHHFTHEGDKKAYHFFVSYSKIACLCFYLKIAREEVLYLESFILLHVAGRMV